MDLEDIDRKRAVFGLALVLLIIYSNVQIYDSLDSMKWVETTHTLEDQYQISIDVGLENADIAIALNNIGLDFEFYDEVRLEGLAKTEMEYNDTTVTTFTDLYSSGITAKMSLITLMVSSIIPIAFFVISFFPGKEKFDKYSNILILIYSATILFILIGWRLYNNSWENILITDDPDLFFESTVETGSVFTSMIWTTVLILLILCLKSIAIQVDDVREFNPVDFFQENRKPTGVYASLFVIILLLGSFSQVYLSDYHQPLGSEYLKSDEFGQVDKGEDGTPEEPSFFIFMYVQSDTDGYFTEELNDEETHSVTVDVTGSNSYTTNMINFGVSCKDDTDENSDKNPNDQVDVIDYTITLPNGEVRTETIECDEEFHYTDFGDWPYIEQGPYFEDEALEYIENYNYEQFLEGVVELEFEADTRGDLGGSGVNADNHLELWYRIEYTEFQLYTQDHFY